MAFDVSSVPLFARSVNSYEEIELSLGRPKLGDVDVKEPDRIP
jgi:hypothetical protein